MPNFKYKAKKGPKDIITGVVQADDVDGAIKKVIQLGGSPLEVVPEKGSANKKVSLKLRKKGKSVRVKKIPLPVLSLFVRQAYDLIDAGVPMLRSLELLSRQTKHLIFKEIVEDMYISVRDGGSLSGSMAKHPEAFSTLFVNMVKSGEMSGNLADVLERLSQFIEKDIEIRSHVRSSLVYPAMILIVGILTIVVMFAFVLPRLTVMFEDFEMGLPAPTRIVMAISDVFVNYWWLMAGGMVMAYSYFKNLWESTKGRMWLEENMLKAPLVGDFIQKIELGRFARTLGTLLDNGVTIVPALESVTAIFENFVLRKEMEKVLLAVSNGASLSNALKSTTFLSEFTINMISVGEESGNLQRGLFKLANLCERETEEVSRTLVSLLGPVVLVFIVSIVGFVIIAMLLPLLKMNMMVN